MKNDLVIKNSFYLEIPIGLKHYFFLNERSKLNVAMSYSVIFNLIDGRVVFNDDPTQNGPVFLPIHLVENKNKGSAFRLSVGYAFSDKYEITGHFYPMKKVFNGAIENVMDGAMSLTLGYKIF